MSEWVTEWLNEWTGCLQQLYLSGNAHSNLANMADIRQVIGRWTESACRQQQQQAAFLLLLLHNTFLVLDGGGSSRCVEDDDEGQRKGKKRQIFLRDCRCRRRRFMPVHHLTFFSLSFFFVDHLVSDDNDTVSFDCVVSSLTDWAKNAVKSRPACFLLLF